MASLYKITGTSAVAIPGGSLHRNKKSIDFKIKKLSNVVTIKIDDLPEGNYKVLWSQFLEDFNQWRKSYNLEEVNFLRLDWTKEANYDTNEPFNWAITSQEFEETLKTRKSEVIGAYMASSTDLRSSPAPPPEEVIKLEGVPLQNYPIFLYIAENLFGLKKHDISNNHWDEV